MVFNSMSFLLFFPIVVLIYWILPSKIKWVWLLIASYYFYMSWNALYVVLIIFVTVVTFLAALCIEKMDNDRNKRKSYRRGALIISLILTLGLLCVFKYWGFIIENLKLIGIKNISSIDVILPVGISFYTFQAIGYVVDVYRGEVNAEKNIGKYALYIAFFPQLVAGPIERSKNLLKQIHEEHAFEYFGVRNGLIQMLWGLFQKIVLADTAAVIVNQVFTYYGSYAGVWRALAAILFALEIYCDFAGYSNIAIGAARVLGFELMDNFKQPYFATSIQDFWRRWHISLSQWFRDYVYIPLGGNRCSKFRRNLNLMIIFGLSGLWHGAGWNYIVWGLLHGLYQVIGNVTKKFRDWLKQKCKIRETPMYKLGQMIGTFFLVVFAWIFFRIESLESAFEYIEGILKNFAGGEFFEKLCWENLGLEIVDLMIFFIMIGVLIVVSLIERKKTLYKWVSEQNLCERWIIYLGLIVCILLFGTYGNEYTQTQFIYFQF